jgi:hypothetical protein
MKPFLSRTLRRLALRHYRPSKAYYRRRLRRQIAGTRGEVVVYQMGKVGSSSLTASFGRLSPPWFAHHIHQLTAAEAENLKAFVRRSFDHPLVTPAQLASLFRQLVSVEYLRKRIGSDWPWKVVTLVRDPVARNLSGFFEILDLEMSYGLESRLRERGADEVVRELGELFLRDYPNHDLPLTFFDIELKRSLGVDVYDTPFPKERGYHIYRHGNVEVLLLKLETLDDCVGEAVERFLGIEGFEVVRSNIGSEKGYAATYRGLLRSIRLPDSYLDEMYGSRYTRHFYTPGEIAQFDARWRRRDPDGAASGRPPGDDAGPP